MLHNTNDWTLLTSDNFLDSNQEDRGVVAEAYVSLKCAFGQEMYDDDDGHSNRQRSNNISISKNSGNIMCKTAQRCRPNNILVMLLKEKCSRVLCGTAFHEKSANVPALSSQVALSALL